MTSEALYDKIKNMAKKLQSSIENNQRISEIEKINFLIKEIDNTKPLNGNGYFDLTKSTLTSIVSISCTYFIILLQFRNPGNDK